MRKISGVEFKHICDGIYEDRKIILKHNPIGTPEEVLLWMLMNCLVSYLSMSEIETPCFSGKPDAETYYNAISYILKGRKSVDFDEQRYLADLVK